MAGRKSEAVKAAQARLRQRVEGQLLVVEAFVRADEQVEAAHHRLKAVVAENEARVAAADGDIGQAKRARAEMLAGLAAIVNDDDEAAILVEVTVAEVAGPRSGPCRSSGPGRSPPRPVAARRLRPPTGPRSRRRRPRRSRRGGVATTALFLDGWDEQSILGTDELTGGCSPSCGGTGRTPSGPTFG